MRALVTGCGGFIGSHLTESLLDDGHTVVGIDCFHDNYARAQKLRNLDAARQWESFEFVPIDLSRGRLEDLVDDCDVVFHLAAEPGVRSSWGARFETYLLNNVLATQQLLEAAKRHPDKRFVYASSSSVYGQAEKLPTDESVAPKPFSPYGCTKLAAEQLCQLYHDNYGVQTVSLRYFSVYGPRQRPDMAFAIFCRAILRDESVQVFGDGAQTRDFTFVEDVVTATRAAAVAPVAGTVCNIGGGSQVRLDAAIEIIEELAARPLRVERAAQEQGDVRSTGADTSRARRELGFEPAVALADGLALQFDWARAAHRQLVSGGVRAA
jgi:nucleoside-diphosphate-sugar epimerase